MSLTAPFQMLGDPTAAACVGDVCEIPQPATVHSATDGIPQDATDHDTAAQIPHPATAEAAHSAARREPHDSDSDGPAHLSEHALVNRQLDEDRV